MKNKQIINGFTLIELMFVISIIAVLAAIGVPNFLEAQVRAKASKARSDMAFISVGLENYRLDYGSYPVATEPIKDFEIKILTKMPSIKQSQNSFESEILFEEMSPFHNDEITTPSSEQTIQNLEYENKINKLLTEQNIKFSPLSDNVFSALTTPIAYCSKTYFPDVFHREYFGDYSIINNYKFLNLLQIDSRGRDIDQIGKNLPYLLFSIGPHSVYYPLPIPPFKDVVLYDPTNGTVSEGFLFATSK